MVCEKCRLDSTLPPIRMILIIRIGVIETSSKH
jgi:hypothetical protein